MGEYLQFTYISTSLCQVTVGNITLQWLTFWPEVITELKSCFFYFHDQQWATSYLLPGCTSHFIYMMTYESYKLWLKRKLQSTIIFFCAEVVLI